MKWTKNILCLLVILASSVAELSAQSTSSASQVVTFGVRRIALQAPAASYVANTMNHNPVKVTAGFQSRFQAAVEFRTTSSDQTFASEEPAVRSGVGGQASIAAARNSDLNNSQSPFARPVASSKLFVTFTE